MAWIDRLIDYVPDMTEMAGGLLMLGGSLGMGAGLMLATPPLCLAGGVVWLAGWAGPALSERKRQRQRANVVCSPLQEAAEEAAVTALERYMERDRQFRAMVATHDRPSLSRLH